MFKKALLININKDSLGGAYWDELDKLVESRKFVSRDDPSLITELADCDCILSGFQVDINKDVIDAAPNLRYIGVLATAYGAIDIEYAAKKNVPVCNLAGYSTESVAEFVVAILLCQIRGLREGIARTDLNNYDESGIRAQEIKGKEFGVIGLGSIGTRVAEIAAGFGAIVSYWSKSKKETPFAYKDLDELLSTCDYISVNVAENSDTKDLLNTDNVAKVKSGSVIVSTVPPPIINIEALINRLNIGDISFISDHADEMESGDIERLKQFKDRVLLLPPIGFISDEARVARQQMFISNIKAAAEGRIKNRVN